MYDNVGESHLPKDKYLVKSLINGRSNLSLSRYSLDKEAIFFFSNNRQEIRGKKKEKKIFVWNFSQDGAQLVLHFFL